jgi:hypothetical protein
MGPVRREAAENVGSAGECRHRRKFEKLRYLQL